MSSTSSCHNWFGFFRRQRVNSQPVPFRFYGTVAPWHQLAHFARLASTRNRPLPQPGQRSESP
ncbi:hypothetical protein QC763_0101610 [Podospora pseudopauciseta]|uniref:Uncharacterized protein n=2 Tax=Podospora TaxID=5144 RepID=A0ABR0H761_9PEZI|nr:hypothetical protein QC763_0101610 [Podospora pseudopauciseta]KAK4672042.1 hypothetical protein QC764_0101490 [Podospora pseudoanserina]